jgi:hypothetical protein
MVAVIAWFVVSLALGLAAGRLLEAMASDED